MKYIAEPVERLIEEFAKLPGIGPKTAQRLAFYLLNAPVDAAYQLANALIEVREKIEHCNVCGNYTDRQPCALCADPHRQVGVICVVEHPRDVIAIEKTGRFNGSYHVLHGALAPMEGISAEDLNIKGLLNRLKQGPVEEVILATNPSIEGDTTAMYLARLLKPLHIKVTRLAHGLPVGADLEYTDEYTLIKALQGRHELD